MFFSSLLFINKRNKRSRGVHNMGIRIFLVRGLLSIGIGVIWLLSLVCLYVPQQASCVILVTETCRLSFSHNRPYNSRFIANSSSCTTNVLSLLLTHCLTAIKNML